MYVHCPVVAGVWSHQLLHSVSPSGLHTGNSQHVSSVPGARNQQNRDWHQTSPCNINAQLRAQVSRIKEMI